MKDVVNEIGRKLPYEGNSSEFLASQFSDVQSEITNDLAKMSYRTAQTVNTNRSSRSHKLRAQKTRNKINFKQFKSVKGQTHRHTK
mmetsp:Transcript_9224/g.15510  ORF Transcript_9224/g.15510 Transcript_9224/m.15510 type:complete len:86 (+) Transcript_9224:333-590(+)